MWANAAIWLEELNPHCLRRPTALKELVQARGMFRLDLPPPLPVSGADIHEVRVVGHEAGELFHVVAIPCLLPSRAASERIAASSFAACASADEHARTATIEHTNRVVRCIASPGLDFVPDATLLQRRVERQTRAGLRHVRFGSEATTQSGQKRTLNVIASVSSSSCRHFMIQPGPTTPGHRPTTTVAAKIARMRQSRSGWPQRCFPKQRATRNQPLLHRLGRE